MKRRDFLKHAALQAGAVALAGRAVQAQAIADTASPARAKPAATLGAGDGGFYTPNRAPLQPGMFQKLPPGSIEARGWLKHQLDLQLDGLNGRMTEVSDYLDYDNCGWIHPEKTGWEEVPYWLRGFGDLGYVTGNKRVLDLTKKWIDGILATQQPDGMFGPTSLRTSLEGGPDFWPGMPLLDTLRSFYEYTSDPRILPFMTRYFRFQHDQPAKVFGRSWAAARWGDTIDSIFWLYNRTGDGWLLDLARKVHTNGADYTNGLPTLHNVNLAQGFREPAQFGVLAGQNRFREATYRDYDTVMRMFGQFPGGGFAGDENCRNGHGDPRQGFETCGIVELMHSFEILTRITGDPLWSDRCEEIAFNNMPAAFDPQQKGTHYITCANGVMLDDVAKKHGQFSNDWAMLAYEPGIHNYRCCPHNYGMGWPYYAQELWLATRDGGLCASLYAASKVTAKVGNNGHGDATTVSITSATDYPFKDTIEFALSMPKPVEFPLYLRIPGWCKNASASVNGFGAPMSSGPGTFLTIRRTWKDGDRIKLVLPMTTSTRTWEFNHNAVSVHHGPLAFSLALNEHFKKIGGSEQWPHYAVSTPSPWNYGLQPDAPIELQASQGAVPSNPWTPAASPLRLKAKARRIPQWTTDSENVVRPLQPSPAKSTEPVETVTLIPMGAARLRITTFPTVGEGVDATEWEPHES